ncbi:HesA/MoeB/ThiF family protein [Clostridium sp. Cult3]|uniref:HesA/MoeB/ThiF family protein n=1 Tax=Clostridium sp. Cult3 TaxID=2079004 RepID=UPI001F1F3F3F|nr:HesA/MoeB/ThiF family protein [Clostridium sp. Cult3]MCF6459754.1 molybdopterin biosynthesis protein MoeB [Clostridium sp. Cult3]
MKRYERNMDSLSIADMNRLNHSKVCVIGCGGLGGYVVEMLGRIGVGYITAIDGDVFDETNLNRQIVCHTENISMSKANETKKRMKLVNPHIQVNAIETMITESNVLTLIQGHDVIVDALDNIQTRFIVKYAAEKLNIPMVHGAIAGFYGQVATILPGDDILDLLYPPNSRMGEGVEKRLGNPSFIPPLIASIQVAEVIKLLTQRGKLIRNKVLFIDLLNSSFDLVTF